MIYDPKGNEIADIPLSEISQNKLQKDGANIVVLYHTPRMLQGERDARAGSFTLRRIGDRLVSDQPTAVKEYADIQKAFAALQKRRITDEPR